MLTYTSLDNFPPTPKRHIHDGGPKIGRGRGAVRVEIGPFLNRSKHALGDEAFKDFQLGEM